MAIAISLHILSAFVWIGGMFFAYMCLRPAAGSLEPAQALSLWNRTFARFFAWVWIAVVLLPVTGFWMAFQLFGEIAEWPVHIHLMMGIGLIMILIYLHVFFAPYRRLRQALSSEDLRSGRPQLEQIRMLVAINLGLGMLVSVIASAGRYL